MALERCVGNAQNLNFVARNQKLFFKIRKFARILSMSDYQQLFMKM